MAKHDIKTISDEALKKRLISAGNAARRFRTDNTQEPEYIDEEGYSRAIKLIDTLSDEIRNREAV